MEISFAQLSSQGPVRTNNEDSIGFRQSTGDEERRSHGALAVLADGVGGMNHGEVASKLAVETSLQTFKEAKANTPPNQLMFKVFTAANLAVYDHGMDNRSKGRMATTLTVALFRNNEITVGHVGDCRGYLIQEGRIRRVTTDHSYAAMQLKLGLITEEEAAASEMKSMLTRSLGKDPTVQADISTVAVNKGDSWVQCSDGLHNCVTDQEITEIVCHETPEAACRHLIALAEQRGTEDNLSIQIVHVRRVEQLIYYRGVPIYQEPELPMSHEVEVGQVLDGRFHITSVISRSGMASIFKATDRKTDKEVALKVPFMQFESDPSFFARFQREEAIGRTLNHPCILHIVPVDASEKSRPYIAMELLEGQTLRHLMRSLRPMPVEMALSITSRLCEALDYMHKQGVIHRDMKPENIMLCNDESIRIMDFGIAKAAGQRRLTFTGFSAAMGTPDYMAPEQVKGRRGDERTDIYALGVILYEMVTGSAPFEGANPYVIMNARLTGDPIAPHRRNHSISPQVEEIILHALERDPNDRYPSALAMKADLDAPDQVEVTDRHKRLRPPMVWMTGWHKVRLVVVAMMVPVVVFGTLYVIFQSPWFKK